MATAERGFTTLSEFLARLEREGELHRIRVEVDPHLEAAEIAVRAMREGKKALLFERVKGSKYPLAMNVLASDRRIELALGEDPGTLGVKLLHAAEHIMPPKPRNIWNAAKPLMPRLLGARAARAGSGTVREPMSPPDLTTLPILQTWPDDGGKFITLPQVFTYDPRTGKRNVGMYRIHIFGERETGMHWQIQKGGGFHYMQAEQMGRPLEVAVAVGTDPALLLATIAPLPEGIDEVLFAGFLRGRPTEMTRGRSISIDVPAHAEFVIEGVVRPEERRIEGPFGDHFGHYSNAAMFPVFHVSAITERKNAIFAATVVGKPPMEDKWLGDVNQLILGPLARLMHPEVRDVWAFFEAGFHNLLGVATDQRYAKEAVKTALSLATDGQLSLTKCAITVNSGVNNRDFRSLLRAIRDNFDPHYDFLLIPNVAMDTLDFTSYTMNLGSKMLIDATAKMGATASGGKYPPRLESPYYARTGLRGQRPESIDMKIRDSRVLEDVLLVVKIDSQIEATHRAGTGESAGSSGRALVEKLVADENIERLPKGVKLVAVVSEDIDLTNDLEVLWGIFTRFDAARDVVFTRSRLIGAAPVHEGILGIDATWKPGYPAPCIMDEHTAKLVDSRWSEYGLG